MAAAAGRLLLVLLLLSFGPLAAFAQPAPQDPPLIVESFECRGNVSTSCEFILGQLYLDEGDRLDREREMLATREELLAQFAAEQRGSDAGVRAIFELADFSPTRHSTAPDLPPIAAFWVVIARILFFMLMFQAGLTPRMAPAGG